MILTYKIKHETDFSKELALAKKVAEYGLSTKSITSKDVKHLGLKSAISNQILKKYSRNKKLQRISSVNLTIPNQSIKIVNDKIYVPCLKLSLDIYFDKNFTKINQIEMYIIHTSPTPCSSLKCIPLAACAPFPEHRLWRTNGGGVASRFKNQ